QAAERRLDLLLRGLPTEKKAGVLGLKRQQAAVGTKDDRAMVLAVFGTGVELQARPVEPSGRPRQGAARRQERALHRAWRTEQPAIELLGKDDRARHRERIARGDDRVEPGAMQRLGDAAEVAAELSGVGAVAGAEHDQANHFGKRKQELPQPASVEKRR